MKANLLITMLIFISFSLLAQKIQTYSGAFEKGTASYQYYENADFERIYHGSFDYNNGTVRGFFNNNMRDSIWTFIGEGSYSRNRYKYEIQGKYKEGKMDGLWLYSKTDIITNKVIQSSKIIFNNGIMSSDFEYIDNRPVAQNGNETNVLIKGKYDKDGFYDGEWLIKYTKDNIDFESIRRYRNGFLYWSLTRNLATGEINKRDNNSDLPTYDILLSNFDKMQMTDSGWDTRKYSIIIDGKKYVFSEYVDDERINWEYASRFWYFKENERSNELYNFNFIKGLNIQNTHQTRFFMQSNY